MGAKDIAEKTLEAYNDVFADIVNVLVFDGARKVKEEDLENAQPYSMYKADGELHEQERDISKRWKNQNVSIAFWGLENQTTVDPDMALRVLNYDGAGYRAQLLADEKDENGTVHRNKRYPVVSLVLYFGNRRWNKAKTLREALDVEIDPGLMGLVNDYRLNLYEIAFLDEETVLKFTSDFRVIAEYFTKRRINPDYRGSTQKIRHVDAVLKLMSAITGDERYEELLNDKGGRIQSMDEFLNMVEARGEARGEVRGETRGCETTRLSDVRKLMKNLKFSAEQAMEVLEISEAEQKKYLMKI